MVFLSHVLAVAGEAAIKASPPVSPPASSADQLRKAEPSSAIPSIPIDLSETDVVTQDTPMRSYEKGFQMVLRMGWKPGSGLGKARMRGIVTPLKFQVYPERRGLRVTNFQGMKAQYTNVVDRSEIAEGSDSWGDEGKPTMQLQSASEALKHVAKA